MITDLPARRPWIALLLVFGISAAAIFGSRQELEDRKLGSPRARADQEFSREAERDFGRDGSDVLLLVDHLGNRGDLFDREAASAFTRIVSKVRALPAVVNAFSFDQIPAYGFGLVPLSLFPDADDGESKRAACRKRALEHPVVAGNLLSEDARMALVPLSIQAGSLRGAREALAKIRETAKAAAAGSPVRARLLGEWPVNLERRAAMKAEQVKFQKIGYALSVILALLIFRGPITTLIVAAPPALGVLWTLGILGFTGTKLNGMSMVVMPIIVTMIGFTNAAHVVTQLRRERAGGLPCGEAIAAALRKLFVPCMLSALTTAVGFASLMVAEAAMIRDFGRDCAIGTLLTFLAVMLALPLLTFSPVLERLEDWILGLLRRLPGWPAPRERSRPSSLAQRFGRLFDAVIANAAKVVGVTVLLTVAFALLATKLKPDIFVRTQLPDSGDTAAALAHVDRELGGAQVVRVVCEWPQSAQHPIGVLEKVETLIKNEPLLSRPLSIRSVLAALPGLGRDLERRLPLLERAPQDIVRGLYRPDRRRAVVAARVQDLGVAQYVPVYDRLEERLAELQEAHPGYRFGLAGGAVGWGRYLHRMVNDLVRSLAVAAIIILTLITIAYRSLRIGLIAVLPNLFPLLVSAASLSLFGMPLGLEIVCAFTICLGIAADDSIHFLSRYRAERALGATVDQSLHTSFMRVGQVLLITTTVMISGLGSILLSSLPMYRSFTAIACATLAAALIADLIVLPALLKLFSKRPSDSP